MSLAFLTFTVFQSFYILQCLCLFYLFVSEEEESHAPVHCCVCVWRIAAVCPLLLKWPPEQSFVLVSFQVSCCWFILSRRLQWPHAICIWFKKGKKKSSFSCCQLMIKRKQAALSIYLCSFSLWGGSWAVMETPPVSQTWSMTHLFYNNCSQICVSFNLSAAAVAQSLSCESQPRPPSGFSNSLVRPEPQGKRIPTPQQADGRFPGRQWFCCIRQQNNKRESFKHLVTNQVSCSVFLPVLSLDEQSKDGVFTVIYGEEPVEGQLGWHRTVLCYDLWKLTSVVCVINI